MITRIQAVGLKCQPIDVSLERLTIITGANAVGKTAILDAIALAVLGYHPGLPKTGAGIMQLASGNALVVTASRDTAQTTLRWDRTAAGSVKGPKLDGAAPAAMLDLRDYLDRPEAERARYVFARCQVAEGIDRNAVRKFLDGLPADTDAKRAARTHVNRVVGPLFSAAEQSKPLPEWLAAMIKLVGEEAKAAARIVKDGAGAIRTATESIVDSMAAPRVEIEAVRAAHAAEATARAVLNRMLEENEKARRARALVETSRAMLAKLEEESSDSELTELIDTLRQSIKQQEDRLATLGVVDAKEIARRHAAAITRVNNIVERLKRAKDEEEDARRNDEAILAQDRCPCCRSEGTLWKEAYRASRETALRSLAATISLFEIEHTTALDELAGIAMELATAHESNSEVEQARAQLTSDREDLRHAESQIRRLTELRAAVAAASELPSHSQEAIEEAEKSVEHAKSLALETQAAFNEHNGWLIRQAERAKIEERQAESEQVAETLKLAREGLLELEAKLAERTIGPLLNVARRLTRETLGWDIEYRDGEFGYTGETGWVGARTWSGMETRVGYAGLQMALAGQHPERILLIDEMGVMTNDVKTKFVESVAGAIRDGLIHQFVGVDIHAQQVRGQYEASGCKVLTVG